MRISPFNNDPLEISPIEFEKQVLDLFTTQKPAPKKLEVLHNQRLTADDGRYQIDVLITFETLGVDFKVLVECKRHKEAVKRETVQILKDRVITLGAQKGILVTASGFQAGAIKYAKKHGIALLRIIEGKMTYETKSATPVDLPSWIEMEDYCFQLIELNENENTSIKLLIDEYKSDLIKTLPNTV